MSASDWFTNTVADEVAKWAARTWALPPAVVIEKLELDKKVQAVQTRLATIIQSLPPRDAPRRGRAPRPAPELPEERVLERAAAHDLRHDGLFTWCAQCRNAQVGREQCWHHECFMNEGLQGPLACRANPTREMVLVRGVILCISCGGWSRRGLRSLALPCRGPGRYAREGLAALAAGRAPASFRGWQASDLPLDRGEHLS